MKVRWVRNILTPFILIAFIASAMWTYISVTSKISEHPVKELELSILPDYEIISGKDLITWPAGAVLPQGMASYFYATNPTVKVSPTIKISGTGEGVLSGTIQSQILLQSINDKSQIYWQYIVRETPLQPFLLTNGESGEVDQSSFTADNIILDVISLYDMVSQINNELMFQNGVYQLVVNNNINVTGSVNGKDVEKILVQTLPITLQQVSFSIPKSREVIIQYTFNENENSLAPNQILIESVQNNLLQFSITLLLFLLLVILLMINNMNKSKATIMHKRYKEWITEGNVEVKDKLQINILNLVGLVDLAIDLNKRVIYDIKINKYYVLTEDIAYIYDPVRAHDMLDNKQQLGKLLIDKGLLKPEQLEIGLFYQNKIGSRLGESLIALGFIDETTLYSTLAAQQKIDYYELEPMKEVFYTKWLDSMSIQKARMLMALPLGIRIDGRLVIACSEASREGIQKTLEEMFGSEIYVVSTRPSSIYDILKKIETQEKQKQSLTETTGESKLAPFERLTKEEHEQFIASYYRGKMKSELYLKAIGVVDSDMIEQVPQKESLLGWLTNKNSITSEIVTMMNGMDKAVEAMEWKNRQAKQIPSLLDILLNANYLTIETVEWIKQEHIFQGLPIDELLTKNYLASIETINSAQFHINTLESILWKSTPN